MTSPLTALQPLGRALMLPIAVLPLAGLLLRLGQPDLLNIPFIAASGDAIFSNLGLVFALGVAVGFAKDNNGAAALAGAVCFLVATAGAKTLISVPAAETLHAVGDGRDLAIDAFRSRALSKLSVPLGILSGAISGDFYNRFSALQLPDYLAFFGGRRFVPIASGLAGLALALVFGEGWGFLSSGMDALSQAIVKSGPLGLFAYGALNRLLIVTGLHHILNNVVWFLLGDFHGTTGDLNRFFAGDPSAGAFMSGFFPVMMFGLPGACLAMYRSARPERRAAVGGMLLSLALTAALTGVTEPIEFSFMFLAPALYLVHAALTGAAMVLMSLLGVKLGFGFSAGLFDYILNFSRATRPLLLLPVGLVYGALYYGLFRVFIVHFDLKTPGREAAGALTAAVASPAGPRAAAYLSALGGSGNLVEVAACTTRLRLILKDASIVDDRRLTALGARGLIRPAPGTLQVVLGPIADAVAGEIRELLKNDPAGGDRTTAVALVAPLKTPPTPAREKALDVSALLAALGGSGNIVSVGACASRLRVRVTSAAAVAEDAIRSEGARSVVKTSETSVHIVVGPGAEGLATALSDALEV